MEEVRLQKYMADCGVASRRKCEEYILAGRVRVNNKVVNTLGTKVKEGKDIIIFDDTEIIPNKKNIYILLNKPVGYVTTVKDQFQRDTVLDLIKGVKQRILPVGRLDMYTSGALILTNDGDFIYKITHPKHEIDKTSQVTLKGVITHEEIDKLENGVEIDGYTTRPAKVKILKIDKEKDISRIQITIHEGKNRQVRKMCEAIDKKVMALHRSKIGTISVKNMKIGEWRYLKIDEIKKLTLQ